MQEKSAFLKVKCKKCKNEQIVFSKAAMQVKCLVCGAVFLQPKGGKADVNMDAVQVLERL
ncbi:MAG: 30S ribosomal protein S27e [Candidatus Aenigmarchaeota archaeon]|nr:30S ribosomal protein S27e [Candidatus Aenigmarchaeota archaeon]